jgi:hypothetical protein
MINHQYGSALSIRLIESLNRILRTPFHFPYKIYFEIPPSGVAGYAESTTNYPCIGVYRMLFLQKWETSLCSTLYYKYYRYSKETTWLEAPKNRLFKEHFG